MNRKGVLVFVTVAALAIPLAVSINRDGLSWLSAFSLDRLEEQKLNKPEHVVLGDMSYEIRYQSAQKRREQAGQDTMVSDQEELIVYELRIQSSKEKDLLKTEKEKRLQYFGNLVTKDLQLVVGADTARCILAHLEQTSGLTPYLSLQIAFPPLSGWKKQPHTVILFDRCFSNQHVVLKHHLIENEI